MMQIEQTPLCCSSSDLTEFIFASGVEFDEDSFLSYVINPSVIILEGTFLLNNNKKSFSVSLTRSIFLCALYVTRIGNSSYVSIIGV